MSETGKDDMPERFELTSLSPLDERYAAIREAVPEAFADEELDPALLLSALGIGDAAPPERYGLTWPGRSRAVRAFQEPSVGALVPDRDSSKDFDSARDVVIEGDNLEVLKLLQKAYYGRVKMIYIDPPYNTGNEFIYPDNFGSCD